MEALNGKPGTGGFGGPSQRVFTMDLTVTRAGFWSPTGGITYGPLRGTFTGGFGNGGGQIRPGGFGGSGGGRGGR